ncbi:MAG: hypothetical protein IPM35_14150 [Myxococcales bacterium]|nr:hypothetical protein [Myxococcales bacterium]
MPRLVLLRDYATLSGHTLTLQVPAWHWLWRGIVLALSLPLLFALLAVLASLDERGVAAPSVVFAGLGGVSFTAGVLLALASPLLSARTRTTLDFAQGVLTRARSPSPVPLAALSGLRVARPSQLGTFLHLCATRTGAPDVRLLGPLVPEHAREASELAGWLGTRLGLPVDSASVEAPQASSSDQLAGVLCYLPIQGIFFVASLYYLFTAKRRPFVRFCAIQSLIQLGFSIAALAVILIALGVPVALTEPSPLQTALVVFLALALTGYWLWNFGAHAYACWAAYKGRLWVMPWLGFWVRRFLP